METLQFCAWPYYIISSDHRMWWSTKIGWPRIIPCEERTWSTALTQPKRLIIKLPCVFFGGSFHNGRLYKVNQRSHDAIPFRQERAVYIILLCIICIVQTFSPCQDDRLLFAISMTGVTTKAICVFAACLAWTLCNVQAKDAAMTFGIIKEINVTAASNDTLDGVIPPGLPTRPRGSLPLRTSIRARQAAEQGNVVPDEVQLSSEYVLIENATFQMDMTSRNRTEIVGNCTGDQWYSFLYGKCYDIYGGCPQYDYTDASTCINSNDEMLCQWNSLHKVCDNVCTSTQWYSNSYAKCYERTGICRQYDGSDAETCENKSDYMVCAWNGSSQLCDAVCSKRSEWYSGSYGKCFRLSGPCMQYDGTDASTCTTPNDKILCSWDSSKKWCDPA